MKYTIDQLGPENEWQGKNGNFIDYQIRLGDAVGWVTLTQKPGTAAPYVGQEIEGHIEDGPRGKKLKKDSSFNGPPASPSGSPGGSRGRAVSPDERISIQRQTALKAAVEYCVSLPDTKVKDVIVTAQAFVEFIEGKSSIKRDAPVETVFPDAEEVSLDL